MKGNVLGVRYKCNRNQSKLRTKGRVPNTYQITAYRQFPAFVARIVFNNLFVFSGVRQFKEIRRRNSHGSFVSIGDNFHLFDMPGMEPGEGKVREMSKFISGLPTKHGITTMFTMELPKDILRPGTRPKYTDSKNSGGIAFDSKVNMNVYQEAVSKTSFADNRR